MSATNTCTGTRRAAWDRCIYRTMGNACFPRLFLAKGCMSSVVPNISVVFVFVGIVCRSDSLCVSAAGTSNSQALPHCIARSLGPGNPLNVVQIMYRLRSISRRPVAALGEYCRLIIDMKISTYGTERSFLNTSLLPIALVTSPTFRKGIHGRRGSEGILHDPSRIRNSLHVISCVFFVLQMIDRRGILDPRCSNL